MIEEHVAIYATKSTKPEFEARIFSTKAWATRFVNNEHAKEERAVPISFPLKLVFPLSDIFDKLEEYKDKDEWAYESINKAIEQFKKVGCL